MSTGTEDTEDIGYILNDNIDTLTGSVNEYIDLVNKAIDNQKQKAATIQRTLAIRKAEIEHAKAQAEADKVQLDQDKALFDNEIALSKSLVAELDANINKLEIDNAEMQSEIERLASENKESLQEIDALRDSNAKLQEEIDAKNAEILTSTQQITAMSEDINNLNEVITHLEEELASETAGNARLSNILKQKQEELKQKQKEIEQLQTFVEQQKRENDKTIKENGEDLKKIAVLYQDSEELVNKLQKNLTAAKQETQASKSLNESEKQEQLAIIAGLEKQNKDLQQLADAAKIMVNDIANDRARIQKSYDSVAQTTLESTAEIEKLKKQLEEANDKIVNLKRLVSAATAKLTNNSGNSGDGTDDILTNIPIGAEGNAVSPLFQTTLPESITKYDTPVNIATILRENSGTPVNTSAQNAQAQSDQNAVPEDALRNYPGIQGVVQKTSTINPMLQRTVKSAQSAQKQKSAETAQKQKSAETAQPQKSAETAQPQPAKTNNKPFEGVDRSILYQRMQGKKRGGTKKKKYLKKHNSKTSKRKSKSTTKKIHKRFHKINKHTKNNKRH
jgi:hypothetical protein